jgi:hypothetical protein
VASQAGRSPFALLQAAQRGLARLLGWSEPPRAIGVMWPKTRVGAPQSRQR